MKSNVKDDFIIPIVVLSVICIVVSAALGYTQQITAPIIEAAERAAAEAARLEVLPGSAAFEAVGLENMPEGVTGVFKSDKGVTVQVDVKGYGGVMKLIAGIDTEGNIVKSKILTHSETAGLGSKAAEEPFQSQFVGKDKTLAGVETIGGATVSSKAFIGGIKKAFEAADIALGNAEGPAESAIGVTDEKLKAVFAAVESFEAKTVDGTDVIVCGTEGIAIFTEADGYGGKVRVATLFDNDAKIVGVIVDSHTETDGIGTESFDAAFTAQFVGRETADGIEAISGATYSSKAVINAVSAAVGKYETVKGA